MRPCPSERRPCAYVTTHPYAGCICPALALEGSSFCAAHQPPRPVVLRHVPAPRDPNADVLPWKDDDERIFSTAAARIAHEQAARRSALKALKTMKGRR